MHTLLKVVLCVSLLLCCNDGAGQDIFTSKDGSIRNVEAKAMLIGDSGTYFATKRELYKSIGGKARWKEIFSLPPGNNEINCIAAVGGNVFIGTKRGLFALYGDARKWANVFKTIIPEKNYVSCIEVSRYAGGEIVIGTRKGIFTSSDLGRTWRDMSLNLRNKSVGCIGISKDSIYAACDNGIYCKQESGSGWERIYIRSSVVSAEASADELLTEEEGQIPGVGCITFRGSRIYIGTGQKVLYSDNGGRNWIGFAGAGLGGTVNYILAATKSDRLYCATDKGIFEYDKDRQRWIQLYKGMEKAMPARSLIFSGNDERFILAVADKGVYKLTSGSFAENNYADIERNLKSFKVMFSNEPTLKELQQAALRFNEISPDKIKNWRVEARMRALMPKVSVGYDSSRATNYEIYTSATKEYVYTGPDDLRRRVDVSVSWDFGDLIWSSDQTSIDVRSRLTTQLRNDILDDLRRAYYERRRLQFEMVQSPPKDDKSLFEKEMRIQELTQSIDDLTGNYLTDNTRK